MRDLIVAVVTVGAVVALLLWWRELPTTTEREGFLRERIAYLEEVLTLERRSCQQAHEMARDAESLSRAVMAWIGVER